MGVGGGFIMVPAMVYLLRMPAHVAVGTDLCQILFTCIGVTLMQATSNHSVDVVLALLIAAGSRSPKFDSYISPRQYFFRSF